MSTRRLPVGERGSGAPNMNEAYRAAPTGMSALTAAGNYQAVNQDAQRRRPFEVRIRSQW